MSEPLRLRHGNGSARQLMAGAVMHVPSASRRRAMAFTSAAATIGASTVAVAASTASVIKSFVLCVALGVVGGGVISFAASETVARFETTAREPSQIGMRPTEARPATASSSEGQTAVVAERALEVAAPLTAEPIVKEATAKGKVLARDEGAKPLEASGRARPPAGASLFEEQRIIESARAAVGRGDVRTAFSLLDDYDRAYPSKQFWPEALALRIEALRNSGQLAAARALADDFAQKYPHHPLLARVRSSFTK
jgi:hypothetical protein